MDIPPDIFAEPDDIAIDALANVGPLKRLAGFWVESGRSPVGQISLSALLRS